MTTTHRRAAAGLGVLALGLGTALVTVAPAQAAESRDVVVGSGDVAWGYKASFRSYVAGGMNTLPAGQRITLVGPAEFDTTGVSTPSESLPYLLPVTGGTFTSTTDLTIESAGGVGYHFPSHYFDLEVQDVDVVVSGDTASIVADSVAEVTQTFGSFQPGSFSGDDTVIAATTDFDVAVEGDSVTVSLTAPVVTADGGAVLPMHAAGTVLDDLTVTADLAAAPVEEWNPAVQVSQASGFDPAGTSTVTVNGSGFDPAVNLATRPPVGAGNPAGVYVVFGKFSENWRPSEGAAPSARKGISTRWALPEPAYSAFVTANPSRAGEVVLLEEDGTFEAELGVKTDDTVSGVYGVYTYGAGGSANEAHELFTPITFAAANGSGEGDVDVDVDVPEYVEPVDPGAFAWTINGTGAVSLGTAVQGENAFTANGSLHAVTVSDTRPEGTWTINGQVSSFVGGSSSFSGAALGWAPKVTSGDALGGSAVVAGSNPGLTATSALASGTGANGKADAVLGADLTLSIPLNTPAGDYSGVLTLTAVG